MITDTKSIGYMIAKDCARLAKSGNMEEANAYFQDMTVEKKYWEQLAIKETFLMLIKEAA